MSIDLSSKSKLKPAFPAAQLTACLQAELIEVIQSRAAMHGTALSNTPAAIVTMSFPIDSLDVVETLCKLDELLGFNLPHSVVRAGGYDSVNKAIQHVMPRVEKIWSKRNGGAI